MDNITEAAEYIRPLNMNGLQGRMLHLPAKKPGGREILVVYGHHAMLERWWGLIQNFNQFGNVTMPDLPGFGGMDSFYKIGQKPTLDNFADYLAAFVKLKYKRRRLTIVGVSFGFVVATRMLQRYPELAKRVDVIISAAGFARYDDFTFNKRWTMFYKTISRVFAWYGFSGFFRMTALNPWVLRKFYAKTQNAKHKFEEVSALPDQFQTMMDFEIKLWHANDVRTHWSTVQQMTRLDNCKKQVKVPVWHVYAKQDQYLDKNIVEQHLNIIFSEYYSAPSSMKKHVVSVLADKKEMAQLIPPRLRKYLSRH